MPETTNTTAERLQALMTDIKATASACGRQADTVRLLAVSKQASIAAIEQAYAAGQRDFAESRVQDALPKIAALEPRDICWHFIGPIQSNKTQIIAEQFAWVHSLSRIKIAERLHAARAQAQPALQVCLQLKLAEDDDPAREGVYLDDLLELAQAVRALPKLQLRGLMCILPTLMSAAPELQQRGFAQVCHAKASLVKQGFVLDTLSMGMSADYHQAIKSGATMVRLGTALFG